MLQTIDSFGFFVFAVGSVVVSRTVTQQFSFLVVCVGGLTVLGIASELHLKNL